MNFFLKQQRSGSFCEPVDDVLCTMLTRGHLKHVGHREQQLFGVVIFYQLEEKHFLISILF
jgi:hypothetical protein